MTAADEQRLGVEILRSSAVPFKFRLNVITNSCAAPDNLRRWGAAVQGNCGYVEFAKVRCSI